MNNQLTNEKKRNVKKRNQYKENEDKMLSEIKKLKFQKQDLEDEIDGLRNNVDYQGNEMREEISRLKQ